MADYLEFFGLKDDPFKITPDANYFFLSESHQEALSSLRYVYESGEGFAVVVGEPGTGKTLTLRKFIDSLPQEEVRFAYILFPNLSPEELFEAILEDLGIKSEGETKNRLFAKLRDFLVEERTKGRKVLVIVDEAQNLPDETLEELRILSNLETEDTKLLQIILAGQPELEEKLSSEKFRQLRQRITVFVKLRNLTKEETKAYIDYRLSKAGKGNIVVSSKAYDLVYRYSMGIPRLINIIMERAMMAAFVESSHEIKPHHVSRAVESVGMRLSEEPFSKRVALISAVGILLAVLLLSGGYLLLNNFPPPLEVKTKEVVETEVSKVEKKKEVKEVPDEAFVAVPMLNMREGPDTSSEVIYLLREGDRVKILEKGPETWVKVLYEGLGQPVEGWVNGKYLRPLKGE